jgi:ribosome-associated protein
MVKCDYPQRTTTLTPQAAPSAPEGPTSVEPSIEDQSSPLPGERLQDLILARLDDDKAQDVVMIDLKNKSSVADCMIVASGRSHRHVGALADHILRALKEAGVGKAKVEGMPHCDWVLIDAGDVIVHLFRPEVRTFYNLEKIWSVEPPSRAAAH